MPISGTKKKSYMKLSDEEIILLFKNGDDDAQDFLISKYKNFVRAKIKPYFLIGASNDDLLQEGMIGLFKAIRDFDADKNASFITFAEICIVRQVITAVKAATRLKHNPLNFYLSLDKPVYDDVEDNKTMLDVLCELKNSGPEDALILREQLEELEQKLNSKLSYLEKQVLVLYLDGRSYQEISKILECSTKAIDNAIQRIKKKVDKILSEEK